MARPANAKRPVRPLTEARNDLRSLARFLEQQSELERGPSRRRMKWAAGCLIEYLENRSPSLEHAFGLVRSPGNQGALKKWADRAAEAEREGLSALAVAKKYDLLDVKSVREGLKRGREANERTLIRSVAKQIRSEIDSELAAERRAFEKRLGGSE